MRSLLFVPGDSARKLAKSIVSGADVLLIDLEDSVAASQKERARATTRAFLASPPAPALFVRINALDSGLAGADLDAVMPGAPAGIMLPKCCGGADVQHLSSLLAVREAECGLPAGATKILAIATETAASLFAMGSFARASRRLCGLAWGAEDLSADIGAETSRLPDGSLAAPYAMARTLTLLAASAAQTRAIDSVFVGLHDDAGLQAECEQARRDGFAGKMAIHPAQVAIINAAFTPSAQALEQARCVVAAFAAQPEAGVISLDGAMLDKPHLARALKVLERAGAIS